MLSGPQGIQGATSLALDLEVAVLSFAELAVTGATADIGVIFYFNFGVHGASLFLGGKHHLDLAHST
jgi:hypothetical protein